MVLVFGAVACSSNEPTQTSGAGESSQPASSSCPRVSMLSPSGEKVSLTGVWRGDDFGLYDIQQQESCLYWMGQSQDPGTEPGFFWSNVFVGSVHEDFTITGEWGDVPFGANAEATAPHLNEGELTLQIGWDDSVTEVRIVLSVIQRSGGFGGRKWVLENTMPDPSVVIGTLGGSEACPWVQIPEGERYEFFPPAIQDLTYRSTPVSLSDDTAHIVFREGDLIRVVGQVVPPLGSGCADNFILATEVGAAS